MDRLQCFTPRKRVLMLLVGVLMAGCASKMTTGSLTEVNRLESELRRGVSTKADVQRVLGAPRGVGGAVLPTDPKPREVWVYGYVEAAVAHVEAGVVQENVRQQFLLVFFEREVFDGFFWFSNGGTKEER